jgi:hypothetical protein
MHRDRAAVLICGVLATCRAVSPALAANPYGVPVSTAAGNQTAPVAVPDGAGGVIIAWHDDRPTVAAGGVVFAQRLNAGGVPQWTTDGVALSSSGDSGPPVIVADGTGGAIVAFGGSNAAPRAQRVSASGAPQWGPDGVQLTTNLGSMLQLAIAADVGGSGGAIIAWRQTNGAGGTDDIVAQRVTSGGALQWGMNGFGIATSNMTNERLPAVATDNSGGAFFAWNNGSGIRIQRYNSIGSSLWSQEPLSSAANADPPSIAPDGAGGVIVSWSGGGTIGVSVQRVDSAGGRLWGMPGSGVSLALNGRATALISDGAGGAIVTWQDTRSGTNENLYAQRLSSTGLTQWTMDGAAVCLASQNQTAPVLVSDGASGAIITWTDARMSPATNNDVYAQRLDVNGAAQWTLDGIAVCAILNAQESPTIASDGAGGAWIAWQDFRGGSNWDVYASRMSGGGQVLAAGQGSAIAEARTWPNPFQDRVRMDFALPAAETVRMRVFDIHGRRVADLGTTALGAGSHEITWDGRNDDGRRAPEGLYFLRVEGPGLAVSRPIVALK